MEEHIWNLVELYLSGEANPDKIMELQSLLVVYPAVYAQVKDFLLSYTDPDPKITSSELSSFLVEVNRAITLAAHQNTHRQEAHPVRTSYSPRSLWSTWLYKMGMEAAMGIQFLKIAIRNLERNRTISFINIAGLAVGIASAIVIFLWIQNQYSYDQFHKNKESIYQLYNRVDNHGQIDAWSSTPLPLGPTVKAQYSDVKEAVRTNWVGSFVLKYKDKQLESQGYTTDPGFLQMFSFPLLVGNPSTALNSAHAIVLTNKLAKKLFGDANPLGKTIAIDSAENFTVTGILKDLPNNTIFNFEYLVPWAYMKEVGWDNEKWDFNSIQTFVQLQPGVTEQRANSFLKNVYRRNGVTDGREVFVHPLSKWWLYSKFENGRAVEGQARTVHLFELIAVLIMVIACINYMNLGTARSAKRAKEVGVRKVSGAPKSWLIKQFLGESVLVAFMAGGIGLCIVHICLPWFNTLVGKELLIPVGEPNFWLTGLGFVLLTGILAGSYPAFYLSAFNPVNVLKSSFKGVGTLIAPRKVLVVVQFTLAIIFIICTTVIYQQIKYAQTRDTGYDVNNLVYVYMKGEIAANYPLIRNELKNSGAVTDMTRTNSPIVDIWTDNWYQGAKKNPDEKIGFSTFLTDKDFTRTFNLPLLAGRDIDVEKFASDTSAILISEYAAHTLGFENPLGKTLKSWSGNYHIVGVVKNFVAGSPYVRALPAIIQGSKKDFGTISLRLSDSRSVQDNIAVISNILKKNNPSYPVNYRFLDEAYHVKFKNDHNTGKLAAVFSGLTIFISCLGLFALAACMAERRIKEIGIRKVLGASIGRIMALLTRDFLMLVVIAFAIASPIAWWLMSNWLREFPYRASISWWIFGITGFCALLVAFSTVGYQALKAATGNPVKSLRTE